MASRASLDFFLSALTACEAPLRAAAQSVDSAPAELNASACFARAMAMLPSQPRIAASVLEYFYGSDHPQRHFRLPGCVEAPVMREAQGRKGNRVANAQMWVAHENSTQAPPCLWSNMPFGKVAAVVLLARALNVTHLIESGRAGGLTLLHYHHFGFELTSIEMYPLPSVSTTLNRLLPDEVRMLDGNGNTLVPEALAAIAVKDRHARVGVILDGPKGNLAQHLARKIAPRVAFVALDDQHVQPSAWPGRLSSHVADPLWRAVFPLERDFTLTAQTEADRGFHPKTDDLALLLGDRWRPPPASGDL